LSARPWFSGQKQGCERAHRAEHQEFDSLWIVLASLSLNQARSLQLQQLGESKSSRTGSPYTGHGPGFPAGRYPNVSQLDFRLLQVQVLKETAMRSVAKFTVALALALMPDVALGQPSPTASAGTPENVHVQPRGRSFSPNSAEVDAVQRRLSKFNETQATEDALFDRKLTICRRC
jgi:hypothetical protein